MEPVELSGVTKAESTLLVLFIPSVDRLSRPIEQEKWEIAALTLLGAVFGGATAFPRGRGVWQDREQGGTLVFDQPVVIHCYTNLERIRQHHHELQAFLVKLGTETNQGAVGFVIDRTYMEIQFSLEERTRNDAGQS